jgi:hypothetical protein
MAVAGAGFVAVEVQMKLAPSLLHYFRLNFLERDHLAQDLTGGYDATPIRLVRHRDLNYFMKHSILTITSLALVAIGCNQEPTTSQKIEKIKSDATDTAKELKDYSFAQKSEFVDKMQSQVSAMKEELDTLSAKVETSNDKAKAVAKPKLEALHMQMENLKKQLEEAKGAKESGWETVKDGFKKGYGELKDGFQQARQWTSDKIAP